MKSDTKGILIAVSTGFFCPNPSRHARAPAERGTTVRGFIPLQDDASPAGDPLTDCEREILQLLAEGKTNKDIATLLDISRKATETHRANVMRKLRLGSLSDLVRYAIRNDLTQS